MHIRGTHSCLVSRRSGNVVVVHRAKRVQAQPSGPQLDGLQEHTDVQSDRVEEEKERGGLECIRSRCRKGRGEV